MTVPHDRPPIPPDHEWLDEQDVTGAIYNARIARRLLSIELLLVVLLAATLLAHVNVLGKIFLAATVLLLFNAWHRSGIALEYLAGFEKRHGYVRSYSRRAEALGLRLP